MHRFIDAKWSKLTPADAAAISKCWRAVLVIYASVTFVALAAAVITSGKPRLQDFSSMTADVSARSKTPQF
jgi:hypothetical protein